MSSHAILLLAVLFSCSPIQASDPTGPQIWDYCEFDRVHPEFGLPDCVAMPSDPPTAALDPIKWCCTPPDGPCHVTSSLSNCDPDDYILLCEWGMSNADGTITCYD